MLKAFAAAKKKIDRANAKMIVNLLRVNLLSEGNMLCEKIRGFLAYSTKYMILKAIKMQYKSSGLLMVVGAFSSKKRLHG
jgi:hypothetical protein